MKQEIPLILEPKDALYWGDKKAFVLISKYISQSEEWATFTYAMEIKDVGCVIRVSTHYKKNIAEALTYMPGVKVKNVLSDEGLVIGRELVPINI